jgi:hypothetical protein
LTRSRFVAVAAVLALACAFPALAPEAASADDGSLTWAGCGSGDGCGTDLQRIAGIVQRGGGDARGTAQTRDTLLAFGTGDRVHVSTWPMGSSGTDVCAGLGRGIRGAGKTLYAQSSQGRGMPTIQRFPTVGTTPYCTRLTQSAGDSVTFTMTKLLRMKDGRVGRYTIGAYRVDTESLSRRRITFRWDGEGMDTVPAAPVEPAPGG